MKKQIISFLEAYIIVWDAMTNDEKITEYYGGSLTKMLQSFCLAHNLPHTMSADDLLADINGNHITIADEDVTCNG